MRIAFAEHPEKSGRKTYVGSQRNTEISELLLIPNMQVSHQSTPNTSTSILLATVGDSSGYVGRVEEGESKDY